MKVTFQRAALDDIKNEKGGVPTQFRKPLREFLRSMTYIGQGMRALIRATLTSTSSSSGTGMSFIYPFLSSIL